MREIGIEEIDMYSSGVSDGHRFLGMPVYDASTIRPEIYDKIVVAVLGEAEKVRRELLDLGAPPQDVVTFFGDHGGRKTK